MKNAVVLSALFMLMGVSALNAQSVQSEKSDGVKVHPATQTLEHYIWLTKGND